MQPDVRSIEPKMTAVTSYEDQRTRLRLMERLKMAFDDVSAPVARQELARAVHLSPEQVLNIRKGRLKGLYSKSRESIDAYFIKFTQRQIRVLRDELNAALADGRRVDPGMVAAAEATLASLASLIAEARKAGIMARDDGAAEDAL